MTFIAVIGGGIAGVITACARAPLLVNPKANRHKLSFPEWADAAGGAVGRPAPLALQRA